MPIFHRVIDAINRVYTLFYKRKRVLTKIGTRFKFFLHFSQSRRKFATSFLGNS